MGGSATDVHRSIQIKNTSGTGAIVLYLEAVCRVSIVAIASVLYIEVVLRWEGLL